MEVGETFETATAREVYEETGVHLEHKTIRQAACLQSCFWICYVNSTVFSAINVNIISSIC